MKNNAADNAGNKVIHLVPGECVKYRDKGYVVIAVIDTDTVLCRDRNTGHRVPIRAEELQGTGPTYIPKGATETHDLVDVTNSQWEEAERLLRIVQPFVDQSKSYTKIDLECAAQKAGVSIPTIYRWISTYKASRRLTALLPAKRSGGRGVGRLSPEVEAIIDKVIQEKHLSLQKPSVAATAKDIRELCHTAGLQPPHELTVRKRIGWIDHRVRLAKREGPYAAQMRHEPHKGSIPNADFPLSMVEVDHTMLPVIVVHEFTRLPIARPWITLAIDVNTRVAAGMYLSLDHPSALSAGMCLAHAILPKGKWLQQRGLDVDWPIWGVMDNVQMDNALEFRGYLVKAIAKDYGIHADKRPVKKPHYGAHIERLMGTLSEMLKAVPGATFANPRQKAEYDAEGNAILTFQEAEKWIALTLAEYHHDEHSELGTSPLNKWREEILGLNGKLPRGMPPLRLDEEKVWIDFLPFENRVIDAKGIVWDDIYYFHDVLRPWVGVQDPSGRGSRSFRIRRDPRDVSKVYFFDPDLKRYFAIPYRDTGLPPASEWEMRAARKYLKSQKIPIDQTKLFEIVGMKRRLVDEALVKTKAARRAHQKQLEHGRARQETLTRLPKTLDVPPSTTTPVYPGYDPNKARPLPDE